MTSIQHLTVLEAGEVLEQEFIKRFGEQEYQRLHRTLDLQFQEKTTNQEAQVYSAITFLGNTTDQTFIFLALIWLSKKQMSDTTAQAMLEEVRQQTTTEVLVKARKAVG